MTRLSNLCQDEAMLDENFKTIDAATLREELVSGKEIATFDLRDTRTHAAEGHPFASVTLPLGRLELEIASAVPLKSTSIVVHDGGEGALARQGGRKLLDLGYNDVSILAGGTRSWREAGFELFTGVNVVGIAFGEFVEHVYDTPHVSASELKKKIDAGDNVVVLDSRPASEFHNFSIPGATDLPGAELVYRFSQAVTDPETLVVVNCAGRTRSIIGAQALINAGVSNKVVSLANGTMDWLMTGNALDSGRIAELPAPPTPETAARIVEDLRQRFPISYIDVDTYARFRREHDVGERTLYVFDIRNADEYIRGHLPGARHVVGGQLVQQIDRAAPTRNARIVLTDSDDLVRASITASWLLQINWAEVHVLPNAFDTVLEGGPEQPRFVGPLPSVDYISPAELVALGKSATVVDVDTSTRYAEGHIPAARFALRTRLGETIDALDGVGLIVLTSADGSLAAFAADDLAPHTKRPIKVLAGGTSSWARAGYKIERGETALFHPAVDRRDSPYEAEDQETRFAGFRRYLAWELGLIAQLERDGTANYKTFPPAS